jgi:predicted phage terminase large subunit-like protein
MTRVQGTPLHPERYTLKMLLNTKATYYALGQQRWWAALYQQNPSPEEGAYFTKKMFQYQPTPQRSTALQVYQAWDFAITEKAQNDYTVGTTGYQDSDDNLHVADVLRFKSDDSFVIADAMLDNWEAHGKCALLGVEDGQIWKSVESVFKRRCEERKLYPSYTVLKPVTDKFARAQPLRGRMQSGKVWFNDKAEWWDALRQEMLRFGSGGKHDDQVDSLAWLVRLVLTRHAPRARDVKPVKSWKDKLRGLGRGQGDSHMAA